VEAPEQIQPQKLADYLNVMSKAVSQSGMSWAVVKNKWVGTTEALFDFDPVRLAELTPPEIDQLLTDTRLIRNRKKLEAIVHNANQMLELERQHYGFKNYLTSFDGFELTAADLRKRFKFLGDLGAYYFLYVVGEPVPPHEEWQRSHGK